MRIASLLASGTEIVCALGLTDQLVGISHECDYPPEVLGKPRLSKPRFDPAGLNGGEIDRAVRQAIATHGSVYLLDEARLRELDPELIITQAVCAVCAVPTSLAEQVVGVLEEQPQILSLDSHSMDEVLGSIVAVGEVAGVPGRARAYVQSLRRRIDAVRGRVAGCARPRVLAIEWLEPPFAPGHWVPEMIEAAGGTSLIGDSKRPSKQLSWRDVEGRDPDVLVVMPCGYGLEASRREAARHADRLLTVARRAIESERAYVVDGSSYFNRSGPRMADGVEILGALFYPDVFPDVNLAGKAQRWP